VPAVPAKEFVGAVAGECDLDMFACRFADPVCREQRTVTEWQTELMDEKDEVVGGMRVAVECVVVCAEVSSGFPGGFRFVDSCIGHTHRKRFDIGAVLFGDGGDEPRVDSTREKDTERNVGFKTRHGCVNDQLMDMFSS